jgi:hypothetical protein
MTRSFVTAALAVLLLTFANSRPAPAEEPKATGTVDISSSVPDLEKLQAFSGTGVILGTKEWEMLAAAWGYKNPPKVDFTKELLLVGTWRGSDFKFVGDVKNGDLTVELVGNKEVQPGFRYKVVSLSRTGITKFQGKDLPAVTAAEPQPIKERPTVELSGDLSDRNLQKSAPSNGVIATQKDYDALVKVWGIKEAPKVDFTKEVLIVGTTQGGTLDLVHAVKEGDLTVSARGTKDLRDGFRWKVTSVRREGIKTVQGVELPKP